MRLTFGQLVDAANAKRIDQWDHTSQILSLIHNINRDPKSSPSQPEDWHPFRRNRKRRRRPSNYTAGRITAAHDAIVAGGGRVQSLNASTMKVIDDQ